MLCGIGDIKLLTCHVTSRDHVVRGSFFFFFFFFLVTLFRVGFLLSVAYLTVANLVRLGILVQC